ncbi:MAG TPA: hypothetical protein VHU18_13115 [Rhizomicrobium sp.]|jgi:hypothetical protein|nr:hypothetical protein [Rhizomicrobium sp.]
MTKLPYNTRRAIVGLVLAAAILSWINYYAGANWFGAYGKQAAIIGFIALLFAVVFIGPTFHEVSGRKQKSSDNDN